MRCGVVAMVLSMVCSVPMARAQKDLAFTRAKHLRRGINLSNWYAQTDDGKYTPAKLASYMTPADFQLIHDLGFDHVRLSINPEPLLADKQAGSLDSEAMARLDGAVQRIVSLGLVVVLDIHPEEGWSRESTQTDDGTVRFLNFWKSFAHHFAGTDPEKVYFEVLNEPMRMDIYRWAGEQARAIGVIRSQAPRHTIIATGATWGAIDSLVATEPVRDDDVIYTFHDYTPMEFTHQGAGFVMKELATLRGVPYPSSPENIAPLLGAQTDEQVRKDLAWYGEQRWDIAMMEKQIGAAVEWAKERHVPLYCGEFGVFRLYAPPADRARWIGDMRQTLETDGVGWAMWDYKGWFGMVTEKDGVPVVDEGVANALGVGKGK
jgi:hypothetical protein